MTTSTEQAARFTLDKIRNGVPGVGIGPMAADGREHVQLVTDDDFGAAFRRVEPTITSTYETDRDGRTWSVGHTTDGLHFATGAWVRLDSPDVQQAVFTRDLGILLDTLTKNFPVGPLTTTSDEHATDEPSARRDKSLEVWADKLAWHTRDVLSEEFPDSPDVVIGMLADMAAEAAAARQALRAQLGPDQPDVAPGPTVRQVIEAVWAQVPDDPAWPCPAWPASLAGFLARTPSTFLDASLTMSAPSEATS